jgi:hypothetical protein
LKNRMRGTNKDAPKSALSGGIARAALIIVLSIASAGAFAEDASKDPAPYAEGEFPPCAISLRRAEIIGVGVLPFSLFFTGFAFDSFRFVVNGFDIAYAPWPFKPDAAYNPTDSEKLLTLGIAVGLSIVAVGVDLFIDYLKTQEAEKDARGAEASPGPVVPAQNGAASPATP